MGYPIHGTGMVQKFSIELDSIKLLERYLRLAMTTALDSIEEVGVKIIDRKYEHFQFSLPPVVYDQNKYFPVILIGGWFARKKGEKFCFKTCLDRPRDWRVFRSKGKTSAMETAIQYIKKNLKKHGKEWIEQFKEKFGEGYYDGFHRSDGTVGFGYELQSCCCFPEELAISIVHMYYGK